MPKSHYILFFDQPLRHLVRPYWPMTWQVAPIRTLTGRGYKTSKWLSDWQGCLWWMPYGTDTFLGHMMPASPFQRKDRGVYYLPHHPVLKKEVPRKWLMIQWRTHPELVWMTDFIRLSRDGGWTGMHFHRMSKTCPTLLTCNQVIGIFSGYCIDQQRLRQFRSLSSRQLHLVKLLPQSSLLRHCNCWQ